MYGCRNGIILVLIYKEGHVYCVMSASLKPYKIVETKLRPSIRNIKNNVLEYIWYGLGVKFKVPLGFESKYILICVQWLGLAFRIRPLRGLIIFRRLSNTGIAIFTLKACGNCPGVGCGVRCDGRVQIERLTSSFSHSAIRLRSGSTISALLLHALQCNQVWHEQC